MTLYYTAVLVGIFNNPIELNNYYILLTKYTGEKSD